MEDTHVLYDEVGKDFPDCKTPNAAFYGVYDGHGGAQVSELCAQLLHKNIITSDKFTPETMIESFVDQFKITDQQIMEEAAKEENNWHSGTTVVVSSIVDGKLYLANLGDSEACIGRKKADGTYEAVELTFKHKPSEAGERDRIKAAGGYVVYGRVMGSLAVARSLGDKDFKTPYNKAEADYVSADPHTLVHDITDDDEFVILSCDGLWDRFNMQDAVNFVARCRGELKDPTTAAKEIVKESLDRNTLDNVTTIVVYLKEPVKVDLPPPSEEKPAEPAPLDKTKPKSLRDKPRALSKQEIDLFDFLKLDPEDMKEKPAEKKELSKTEMILEQFQLPPNEKVVDQYRCSLETRKKMLHKGILLLTSKYLCFVGTLFSKKTLVQIKIRHIQSIEKAKSMLVASAIRITTQDGNKHLFDWNHSSDRDIAFRKIMELLDDLPDHSDDELDYTAVDVADVSDDEDEQASSTTATSDNNNTTDNASDNSNKNNEDQNDDDDDDEDDSDDSDDDNWNRFDD